MLSPDYTKCVHLRLQYSSTRIAERSVRTTHIASDVIVIDTRFVPSFDESHGML